LHLTRREVLPSGDGTEQRTWRIGELARATGLTIRALHHYDEIGLLVPSDRTDAGHRLYSETDVQRLYLVTTLRDLGMPLHAIAAHLDGEVDVRVTIERHLEHVERQLETQTVLRRRLRRLLETLDAGDGLVGEDLATTMEVITMHENYYTPEQMEQLEQRRAALGDEGMRRAEQEWAELIAAVDAERERGTDPSDERVQRLARQWQGLIEQFTGGDPGILQSLKTMYESEGVEHASRGAVKPELMEYVSRAMAAGDSTS
jgi:DNA-binding transcriptional MerR regulator